MNYILDIASAKGVGCDVYGEDSAGIEIEMHRRNANRSRNTEREG